MYTWKCSLCSKIMQTSAQRKHLQQAHKQCERCHVMLVGQRIKSHPPNCVITKYRCCGEAFDRKRFTRHTSQPHITCYRCSSRILKSSRQSHLLNCKPRETTISHHPKDSFQEVIDELLDFNKRLPELVSSLQRFKDLLCQSQWGKPITANEHATSSSSCYITDSEDNIRSLLQSEILQLPIYLSQVKKNKQSMDEYLLLLSTATTLDVDVYKKPKDNSPRTPISMLSKKAIEYFKKKPCNLLNLRNTKPNPIPDCIQGLKNYTLLGQDIYHHGKRMEKSPCDFTDSSTFHLLASRGAVTLPHIDRGGVITTIFVEHGEKLWITWPKRTHEELRRIFTSSPSQLPPGGTVFHLKPGDLFIQPAGTPHAVLTLENSFLTGTMHLDSRNIYKSLCLTELELDIYEITNEDISREYIPKLGGILALWENKHEYWEWNSTDLLLKSKEVHKRIRKRVS